MTSLPGAGPEATACTLGPAPGVTDRIWIPGKDDWPVENPTSTVIIIVFLIQGLLNRVFLGKGAPTVRALGKGQGRCTQHPGKDESYASLGRDPPAATFHCMFNFAGHVLACSRNLEPGLYLGPRLHHGDAALCSSYPEFALGFGNTVPCSSDLMSGFNFGLESGLVHMFDFAKHDLTGSCNLESSPSCGPRSYHGDAVLCSSDPESGLDFNNAAPCSGDLMSILYHGLESGLHVTPRLYHGDAVFCSSDPGSSLAVGSAVPCSYDLMSSLYRGLELGLPFGLRPYDGDASSYNGGQEFSLDDGHTVPCSSDLVFGLYHGHGIESFGHSQATVQSASTRATGPRHLHAGHQAGGGDAGQAQGQGQGSGEGRLTLVTK